MPLRLRPLTPPRADLAAAVAVAALGFLVNYLIALQWAALGTFKQINLFFDADPMFYMERMGHGWGAFMFKHMNVITFFNPPIRVLAMGLSALGVPGTAVELRESLTLLIVPGMGAVKTLALFALFRSLAISRPAVVLLCLLDIVSFSRIVFGSLPESFAISGALIAVMYWAASRTPASPAGRGHILLWIGLTTVAAGVTITNVIAAGPLLVLDGWRAGRRGAPLLVRAAGIVAAALVLNVALAGAMSVVYQGSIANLTYDPTNDAWLGFQSPAEMRELMFSLTNALLAPQPGMLPDAIQARYTFMFSFAEGLVRVWPQVLAAVTTLLVCAAGALLGARVRAMRPFVAVSAAIVLANLLMHVVFGNEFFLYTQHWQVALLVFAGGWTTLARRTVGLGVLGLFTLAVAISSLAHVRWMIETLSRS